MNPHLYWNWKAPGKKSSPMPPNSPDGGSDRRLELACVCRRTVNFAKKEQHSPMIVVTGATGGLGSAVIEHLLQSAPDVEIVASAQYPDKASALAARGVPVRHGDFNIPETLDQAFVGADRLLLVSASGISREQRFGQHKNAIDAARRVGVGHVYYTSLAFGDDSVAYVMQAHLDTEAYLRQSGLTYTILRNGAYVEAWPTYLDDLISGEVVVPADGPIAWVSRVDLAEGTARLLTSGDNAGETLRLIGPQPQDIQSVVEIAAQKLGRPVLRRLVGVADYVERQVRAGKPESIARQWATTYDALARGEMAVPDLTLTALLDRPLLTVEQAIRPLLTPAVVHP